MSERNEEIFALRQSGMTLQAIGERHSLTRERVRQICLRVEERLARAEKRDRSLDDANQVVMINKSIAVGLSAKLDAIGAQLDAIEREFAAAAAAIDLSIDDLELSARPHNILRNLGVKTVGELLCWSPVDLLRLPNIGRGSLAEIEVALAYLGCGLPSKSGRSVETDK